MKYLGFQSSNSHLDLSQLTFNPVSSFKTPFARVATALVKFTAPFFLSIHKLSVSLHVPTPDLPDCHYIVIFIVSLIIHICKPNESS